MPYIKEVFDVVTFEQAKHVVLTSDPSNPKKFDNETKFLVDTIKSKDFLNISESTTILDFGCGMGRVSKKLIQEFNCNVIGTDISESMLTFAKIYVSKPDKFKTHTDYSLPNSVDLCVCTFVLQHVEHPINEIAKIAECVKTGGYLVLVNEPIRYVPSDVDQDKFIVWKDDGVKVSDEVDKFFNLVDSSKYLNTNVDVRFYVKK